MMLRSFSDVSLVRFDANGDNDVGRSNTTGHTGAAWVPAARLPAAVGAVQRTCHGRTPDRRVAHGSRDNACATVSGLGRPSDPPSWYAALLRVHVAVPA